jgi:SAM-dependent methyltransferase
MTPLLIMPRPLLTDRQLESSSVVANCRMNRERELTGGNGYAREMGFDPAAWLAEQARPGRLVRWLDLCCGSGRALFQAAQRLEADGLADAVRIVGVDLVGMFWPGRPSRVLQLVVASLHDWQPDERFDLVTCVHGLHYLGDKLGLVQRILGWLAEEGLFVANLDLANLRAEDGKPLARRVAGMLRKLGIEYDSRRRRLRCWGRCQAALPLAYLGADDTAGPNSTGQPAVDSYYRLVGEEGWRSARRLP